MPFIKDLGQMERDFCCEVSPGEEPKKKKVFKKVDLPLSITGDKMPKMDEMVVAVIVGPIKGFRNTEHSKEVTIEARSGGFYMKTGENLESKIAAAFGQKEKKNA